MLDISHLNLWHRTKEANRQILFDVSFSVQRKESLVILGESGSGKTILSRAITKLLASPALQVEGTIMYEGTSLLTLHEEDLMNLRRNRIRYIFQEPNQALNPVARIRGQMNLAWDGPNHDDTPLVQVLENVGISDAREVLDSYPHQLSIGQAQRVAIAMALLPKPAILIADEPTSAVDAALKFQLMDLISAIQRQRGLSLLLVTHDVDIAERYGTRIVVLYRGRIVESSPVRSFFAAPLHPYSRLLLESRPRIGKSEMYSVEPVHHGPEEDEATGCAFSVRCPKSQPRCRTEEPQLERVPGEQEVRCFYWK